MRLQPVGEKVEKVGSRVLTKRAFLRLRGGDKRLSKHLGERQTQPILQYQADHTERRSSECKRILRTTRPLVNREERYKAIDLVCERYDNARRRIWASVVRSER